MNEKTNNLPAPTRGQAHETQSGDRPPAPVSAFHDGPINILIVDDEPKNLTVLETVLDDPGYRLVRAESADQALLALVADEFALLILDIQMPGMTGFELAQMIKERKKTARVPITFLTSYYNEDQHVLEGYGTGAVDYLHKPVNPAVLRSKVAVFAELHRKNREWELANHALLAEVTERRRAQEQLRELNETLEQRVTERTEALESASSVAEKANLAKSNFLSSMSHELRTPLNAILGFGQLMESDSPAPTPSQKANIDQILQAGWYLLELINEILDLALIESGKLSISLEPVALDDIMLECQSMIEPQAKKRGIRMSFPRFDHPCFVNADRTRVKQILINLLSNAIKYNQAGGSVVVECAASLPDSIRVNIRDTGAGLPPEKLAQLFQPFNRLGQEASAEEGTGIGLVVTKRLVELMGGTIGVGSVVGVGSVFWVELNSASVPSFIKGASEPAASAQTQIESGAPLRTLLYVEDNPANLKLVEQLIARRPDMRLLTAVNGNLGIELAHAAQPEVIFMDINLPGMSGTEAMKILRKDRATAHIPVLALSANAIPHDIEKGLEAGFFRYLTKPIKINEFMEALNVALEHAETRVGEIK